jgi:hypothetical protein
MSRQENMMSDPRRIQGSPAFLPLLLAATLAVAPLQAQPPAGARGPALAPTLKFIQDKISQHASLVYQRHLHGTSQDSILQFAMEVTQVAVDEPGCVFGYHWMAVFAMPGSPDKKAYGNRDERIALRDIEKVEVVPQDELLRRGEKPTDMQTVKVDPAVSALQIHMRDGTTYGQIQFYDGDLADRVARALIHAVELCGGSQEPF